MKKSDTYSVNMIHVEYLFGESSLNFREARHKRLCDENTQNTAKRSPQIWADIYLINFAVQNVHLWLMFI